MKTRITIILFATSFLTACIKDEIPVTPYDRGDVVEKQLAMESDYRNQLFFSLEAQEIISANLKSSWDLAFSCATDGYQVQINGANAAKVYETNKTNFQDFSGLDFDNLDWEWDRPHGDLDSTAIGDYRANGNVFIMDRGYDEEGNELGRVQFRLIQESKDTYKIFWATTNGNHKMEKVISKDASKNNVCFSFDQSDVVKVEPNKEQWDLLFSQYTHIFFNPFTAYTVTGVLINPNKTEVAIDTSIAFVDLSMDNLGELKFTRDANAIGYNWKYYSLSAGQFTVYDKVNYIIKTNKGFYYKLHFVDFYNAQGEKGFPKFEFQKL